MFSVSFFFYSMALLWYPHDRKHEVSSLKSVVCTRRLAVSLVQTLQTGTGSGAGSANWHKLTQMLFLGGGFGDFCGFSRLKVYPSQIFPGARPQAADAAP